MKFLLTILISISMLLISCSVDDDVLKTSDDLAPPAFPYVFMGSAYVNGEPIKEGTVIRASFGKSISNPADTLNGRYMNLIVVPENEEDVSEKIFFEIVDASGNTSKSREEYKIEVLKEPSIVNLVLNFTKYP